MDKHCPGCSSWCWDEGCTDKKAAMENGQCSGWCAKAGSWEREEE